MHYLATAIANLVFAYRPQRVIVGGGVMNVPGLLERVRQRVAGLLNDAYLGYGDPATLVVPPGHGDLSGVVGAIALARRCASGS